MIDADRITRVIAQRCPELTLTDLAAVDSGLYGDATNAILVKRLRRLHRRLGADRRQTGRLGSRRMIDPADVKILASHCAYDVLQSEEAVFVVEEFYAGRLDPIAVLRLSMCDRNVEPAFCRQFSGWPTRPSGPPRKPGQSAVTE